MKAQPKRRSLFDVTHTIGVPAVSLPATSALARAALSRDAKKALPAYLRIYGKLAEEAESKGFDDYASGIRNGVQKVAAAVAAKSLEEAAMAALFLGATVQRLKADAQYAEFAYQGWRKAEGRRIIETGPTTVRRNGREFVRMPLTDQERQRIIEADKALTGAFASKSERRQALADQLGIKKRRVELAIDGRR